MRLLLLLPCRRPLDATPSPSAQPSFVPKASRLIPESRRLRQGVESFLRRRMSGARHGKPQADAVSPRRSTQHRPGPRPARRPGVAVGGGVGTILIVIVLAVLGVDLPGGTSSLPIVPPGRARHRPLADLPDRQRRQPARGLPHRRRRQLGPGVLERPARRLPRGADELLLRPGLDRLRHGQLGRRPVLLPGRPERLHRPRLLRRPAQPLRGEGRPVRGGVRDRARVRAPRPAPARHRRARRRRPRGRDVRLGPARAAGRLLRRRVGRARGRDRLHRGPHRRPTSRTASTRRPRSATTGSRSAPPAASIPRAGPTAPRPRARSGSTPAIAPATRAGATRSRRATYDPAAGAGRTAP